MKKYFFALAFVFVLVLHFTALKNPLAAVFLVVVLLFFLGVSKWMIELLVKPKIESKTSNLQTKRVLQTLRELSSYSPEEVERMLAHQTPIRLDGSHQEIRIELASNSDSVKDPQSRNELN